LIIYQQQTTMSFQDFRIALGGFLGVTGGAALAGLGGWYLYNSEIGSMDFILGSVLSIGGGIVLIDTMRAK
ncbi:hypothetical protein SAMD00019534_125700, partial [Acytostelium subglobosum LB1]|uniref:hypothetical protein n=1 Tax=Acytostelium subglobosum LB1 TaxID=1410327 RepID=UPI00064497AD